MSRLTKKQREEYIKSPYHCPKCGGRDISAGEFEPEAMYIVIECENCGGSWEEIFTLIDIQNFKEKKNNSWKKKLRCTSKVLPE